MSLVVCRICTKNECSLIPLHETVLSDTSAVELITLIAQIEIRVDDNLPQSICTNCMNELERTNTLIKTCKDSDIRLREMITTDKDENEPLDGYHVIEAIHEVEVIDESDVEEMMECSGQEGQIELLDIDDIIEEETFDSDDLITEDDPNASFGVDELIITDPTAQSSEEHNHTQCCGCAEQFDSSEQLKDHSRACHLVDRAISGPVPTNLVECSICYKLFSGISYIDSMHQLEVFKDRLVSAEYPEMMQCCSCDTLCCGQEELSQHSLQHLSERKADDPSRPFECKFCYKRYIQKQTLSFHQRFSFSYKKILRTKQQGFVAIKKRNEIERSTVNRKCCGCSAKFPSEDSLKQHSQMHHELYRRQSDQSNPFECDICFKQFPALARLEQHKLAPYARSHQCSQCEKSFISSTLLAKHIQSHDQSEFTSAELPSRNNGPEVQCDECGKMFKNKHHLKRHHKCQHSQEKPFSCSLCFRKFKWKHTLQNHLRVHTREKPFSCGYCERKFTNLTDKNRHELSHSKQFPMKCTICDKGFAAGRRKQLEKHMQLHEAGEEFPLACQYCDRTFGSRLVQRNRHQARHLAGLNRILKCEMEDTQ